MVDFTDVLIVGAGLSGIGAAVHLRMHCPSKSFAIVETRAQMGGTWDLFRYPGIRSDSDMYTLGYNFKPWTNPKAIADGGSILSYIKETATEHDLNDKVLYQHKVIKANWNAVTARWTMLQRSPTYMGIMPSKDRIANGLRKILPSQLAYKITRWKNLTMGRFIYNWMRKKPEKAKAFLLSKIRKSMGSDYPLSPHFTPNYKPWDQRLCLVPDNDLFDSLKAGHADVVTAEIERFTADGIKLKTGEEIKADIIITATGLNLQILGGAQFSLNDKPIDFSETFSYEGMMFSGVPNMASVFGYVNASWTLRADLISQFVCRLLNHMEVKKTPICMPIAPKDMPAYPWFDFFKAGYLQRSLHQLPKQGNRDPWLNEQNYMRDRKVLPSKPLDDGVLNFSTISQAAE